MLMISIDADTLLRYFRDDYFFQGRRYRRGLMLLFRQAIFSPFFAMMID